ncbi:MAG: GNAT family N-acetyltransferase [Candidatus Hodarchaeota archaeon]
MIRIRRARLEDLPAITKIYNDAIIKTVATFDTKPKSIEEQKEWFEKHGERYPILVAEIDNKVVGWTSLSEWSDRCAYSDTAEISLYIEEGYRGRGIGKKLTETILREGKAAGLHTIIARVTEGNDQSIHILEKYGFNYIGIMKEVGRKFGKLFDVHLLQKIFE